MNIISNQTEICFLDPSVLNNRHKTVIFGHFSSDLSIDNYTKTRLVISTNSNNNITGINVFDDFIKKEEKDYHYRNDPDLLFDNEVSLSNLLSQEQLQCYESLFNNDIIAQIILIEVESLLKNKHSYLFFGFADVKNPVVIQNHSKVFYTEDSGIKIGGEATHVNGDQVTNIFSTNYSFGFGKNLKTFGQSPKKYTDAIHKYMKLVESEKEEHKKVIKFIFNDSDYIEYLKKLNKQLEIEGLPYTPFWLTKEMKDKYNSISMEVMKKMME